MQDGKVLWGIHMMKRRKLPNIEVIWTLDNGWNKPQFIKRFTSTS
jgi:hypothetical protein